MNELVHVEQYCPYCGETVGLMIDCSIPRQEYIEDCRVCCQPMIVMVEVDVDGTPTVYVRNENE